MYEPQGRYAAQDDIGAEDDYNSSRQSTPLSNEASFFTGAKDTKVHGGSFIAVGGSVNPPGAQRTGPVGRPQQPRQNASFFKDTTGTEVNDGQFMAIVGDLHESPPHENFQQGRTGVPIPNDQAPTAPSTSSHTPGSHRGDTASRNNGTNINPTNGSVTDNHNQSTSLHLESAAVGAPFKNSLVDTADKELFSLCRSDKPNPLYKIIQIELRYGMDGGVAYSVLAFRLEKGEDEKKCLAVRLKGEFIRSAPYQNVNVKEIRCVPEDTPDTLTQVPVQLTSTKTGQITGGIAAGKPTFQATLSLLHSVQTTLIGGQSSQGSFDDSKGTFNVTLGVDSLVDKKLSVVNPARFAVLLKLEQNRQPMKLRLTLEVTYRSKYKHTGTKTLSRSFEADYSGNEFYDIVKAERQ